MFAKCSLDCDAVLLGQQLDVERDVVIFVSGLLDECGAMPCVGFLEPIARRQYHSDTGSKRTYTLLEAGSTTWKMPSPPKASDSCTNLLHLSGRFVFG